MNPIQSMLYDEYLSSEFHPAWDKLLACGVDRLSKEVILQLMNRCATPEKSTAETNKFSNALQKIFRKPEQIAIIKTFMSYRLMMTGNAPSTNPYISSIADTRFFTLRTPEDRVAIWQKDIIQEIAQKLRNDMKEWVNKQALTLEVTHPRQRRSSLKR